MDLNELRAESRVYRSRNEGQRMMIERSWKINEMVIWRKNDNSPLSIVRICHTQKNQSGCKKIEITDLQKNTERE